MRNSKPIFRLSKGGRSSGFGTERHFRIKASETQGLDGKKEIA